MRTTRLLVRRARAQRGTLLTLLVLTATVAAILAGSIGYTRAAGVATVRSTLEDAAPRDAGIQVQTRLGEDPAAQDAAARATLDRLLGAGTVETARTLWTEGVSAETGDGEVRVVLASAPAGTSAPAPGEVLVPEHVAADAGLAPGAELTVGGTTLTVAGTWQPADERAWFAGPLVVTGTDGSSVGPLVADEATVTEAVAAPFVRWTVYPRAAALTVAELPDLTAGLAELDYALGNDDAVAVRGLTLTGDLATTVAELEAATSTAAAVGLVPVALLGVISLVALVQVVRLLGQTRGRETEILVARGAAARQVTVWSAAEIGAVAVAGAAIGTVLAAVVVGRLAGGDAQRPVIVAAGVTVAVLTVATGTAVAGLQARGIARRLVADRSGRLQGAAAAGTVVLTGALAVLSAWQLLRHGTPLITADDGATQADVLAVLSLGAVLAALAVLALALLGPLTRVLARLRERRRGLVGVLAARQVSRRVRAYAVPLVLVVLAVGTTTVASTFAGATTTQREQVAAIDTGSDVRVTVPTGAASRLATPRSVSAVPFRELPGVAGAGVVLRGPGGFGELPVAVTALDTARLDELVRAPEEVGLGTAAAELAPAEPGPWLPAGTGTAELTVRAQLGYAQGALEDAEAFAAENREFLLAQGLSEEEADEVVAQERARALEGDFALETVLWLADGDGALSMVELPPLSADPTGEDGLVGPEPSEHTLTVPVPTADEYRVAALELGISGPPVGYDVSYEVTALTADGQELALDAAAWETVPVLDTPDVTAQGAIGLRAELGGPLGAPDVELRLMPPGSPTAVPAVLTRHLAAAADLAVGDAATVNHAGADLDLTVRGLADAVPGGLEEDAVLVDLATLGTYVLATRPNPLLPGQVWLAVADDADVRAVAAAAEEVAGSAASLEVAGEAGTDSAASVRQAFWIVAVGATLLALTGVAAVVLALARERRSEVMVLRALGLPAAGQARTRVAELLGVGVLGAVLGVLAGAAASALLVPTLARAAATQASPLPLGTRVDLPPALAVLAVLAAGLLAVSAALAARVRAQALDAEYREEVR